LRNN
jgi:hypothetical protein